MKLLAMIIIAVVSGDPFLAAGLSVQQEDTIDKTVLDVPSALCKTINSDENAANTDFRVRTTAQNEAILRLEKKIALDANKCDVAGVDQKIAVRHGDLRSWRS